MSLTILLLMQPTYVSRLSKTVFNRMGFRTVTVHTPDDAMAFLEKEIPLCILTEPRFPGYSHLKLLCLIKSHPVYQSIPLILLDHRKKGRKKSDRATFTLVDASIPYPMTSDQVRELMQKCLIRKVDGIHFTPSPELSLPRTLEAKFRIGEMNINNLLEVLNELETDGKSGVFSALHLDHRMQVMIQNGKIIGVSSDYIPEESFGSYLERQKIISGGVKEELFAQAKETGKPLGNMLVKKNTLRESDLIERLRDHKLKKVFNLFSKQWAGAQYSFWSWDALSKGYQFRPCAISEVIKQGILAHAYYEQLQFYFKKNNISKLSVVELTSVERGIKRFDLDEADLKLAESMNHKTIAGMQATDPDNFDKKLRILCLLDIDGDVRFSTYANKKTTRKSSLDIEKTALENINILNNFKESLEIETENFETLLEVVALEDYEEGVKLLKKWAMDDLQSTVLSALAIWMKYQGKQDKSFDDFLHTEGELLKVAYENTDESLPWYLLSILCRSAGFSKRARRYIRKAAKAEEDNPLIVRESKKVKSSLREASQNDNSNHTTKVVV